MSSLLTDRQATELSIVAYLSSNGFQEGAQKIRSDIGLSEAVFGAEVEKTYKPLLEKKWTISTRLQKKITDLESKNTSLQSELNSVTSSLAERHRDPTSWLPSFPQHTLESHRDTINCLAFHPVYSSIATGSDDFTIKIWDRELGELEQTIKGHTRAVLDLDYGMSRGGTVLASCGSDLCIKIWAAAEGYKNVRTLMGHEHTISAVRFIPTGAALASSGDFLVSASRDKSLRIWDVNTGYCVRTLLGHSDWVRDVCPSSDGHFLLSTGDDMTARLWDIRSAHAPNNITMSGHEHVGECCAIAPPTTYKHLATLAGLKNPPPTSSFAEYMATGSRDRTIRIWDASGSCVFTLIGHDNWVRGLAFHPGGKYLLSVSDDKTLRCWDISQGCMCVKIMSDIHERFITCLRWAPGLTKSVLKGDGGEGDSSLQIRCVIATGGVDRKLRLFAG